MDADVRRSIDMGTRTHTFGTTHAVASPDFGVLLTQLTGLLARGTALAAQQRDGFVERAAASARKRELERTIRAVHVAHLAQAGQLAARDDHEIGSTFRLAPATGSFTAFRTAVGSMAEAAERHREALVKRGMSGTVLADLGEAVKQFDLAVERANAARAAHVAASAELRAVGAEIVQVVRMLDAVARLEFKDDPSLLAAWKSVSRRQAVSRDGSAAEVPGPAPAPTTEGQPATPAVGDVRPAA